MGGVMESIPAGWHPDPQGVGHERYHDGTNWTDQIRSAPAGAAVATSTGTSSSGSGLRVLRLVALVVILVLAIGAAALALTGKPEEYDASDSGILISAALSSAEANEALADSAPQQQVVNGWVARDLLSIIARQNDSALAAQAEIANQQARTNQLLRGLLLVLVALVAGVAVIGATVIDRRRSDPSGSGGV